jgi:tartrate-resistant acid phosphatase type 5
MNQNKKNASNLLVFLLITFSLVAMSVWFIRASRQSNFSSTIPTPAPVPQTFLLVADTGTGLEDQYAVSAAMRTYCESDQHCKAAFIAGDVIYDKGVEEVNDIQFKTKFEDVYKDVQVPFFIALGNHDYLGCEECYTAYASHSAYWKFPSSYYAQEFESVVFIVIDTEKFDSNQQNWLRAELKNYGDKKKVIVGHRPLLSYEVTKIKENWYGKDELKNIVCNEADYYVSGHAHVFEYLGQLEGCKVKLLVIGTGGATLRQTASPYPGEFATSKHGFVSWTATQGNISWKFISSTGEVVFSK